MTAERKQFAWAPPAKTDPPLSTGQFPHPRITSQGHDYDEPRVNVEPHRAKDRQGVEHEVTGWWLNGPAYPQAMGHKIKKDGTPGRHVTSASVKPPPHVHAALMAEQAKMEAKQKP